MCPDCDIVVGNRKEYQVQKNKYKNFSRCLIRNNVSKKAMEHLGVNIVNLEFFM